MASFTSPRTFLPHALLAVGLLSAGPLLAQAQPAGGEDPTIVLDEGRAQIRLAIPATRVDPSLSGDALQAAREIEETLRNDLDRMILFETQGPTELSVLVLTGVREQDFDQYRSLGNDVVLLTEIKAEGDRLALDGWIYDLPSKQSVLGKRYRGTFDQARLVAHYLSDAVYRQFQGRPSLTLTTLAFQSDRDAGDQELYLMDYDGYHQRRISGHRSTSGYSSWSPDGDALAYMSYFSGSPGIYYVDIASGEKIPIYTEGILNLSPSFAPDGQRLAFASSRDSNIDIYTCARRCTSPTRITRSAAIDTNPAWSPDGSKIAFTSSRSGRPNVYVMDADGSNVRRVSFEGNYNEGAAWSPDGSLLAYASRERGKFRVVVTSLVDLVTRIVVSGPDSYEEPAFSPDGRQLAYTTRRGKSSQVYVTHLDGSGRLQLTHQGNNSSPAWSGFPSSR
ncbi:MAG: hypothetical protein AAGE94_13935 [Acidobacteriota bacterium]